MSKTIAQLEEDLNQLKAKLSKEKRKADTRRKVLIGSCVLSAIEQGVLNDEWVKKLLNKFVSRPSDRTFLGLQPLTNQSNGHQASVDEIVDNIVGDNNAHSSEHSHQ